MEHTSADENFALLGLSLPQAPKPAGVYKPLLVVDRLVYVSGHGPVQDDGSLITGKAGRDLDADAAKMAAQQVGLTILATLKTQLGTLDKIGRVVKVLGMVNATLEFGRHPYVVNGCSELFCKDMGQ